MALYNLFGELGLEETQQDVLAALLAIQLAVADLDGNTDNIEALLASIDVNTGNSLTDAELRATPVPVSGTVTATGGLTDAELRATPVPVSGTVTVTDGAGPLTVDGTVTVSNPGLTDTQLRATPVPVSGTVTSNIGTTNGLALDATLTGGTQKAIARGGAKGATTPADATSTASGVNHQGLDVVNYDAAGNVLVQGLTDTQLRATPVPVSGTVSTGGLTDTQLRATPVPVSGTVTVTDGSGPLTVDGTVTANIGTTNGLALDATLTGGTQKAIARGGAKGATTASDVTSTSGSADRQMLDVITRDATGAVATPLTDTQLRATPVPVSGTVTSNIGTTNGLALDATLTGGTQKAIARGGAKGATVAADVTSTAAGANHQALDVAVLDASGNQVSPLTDTQLRATPVPVSGTVTTGGLTDTQLRATPVPMYDQARTSWGGGVATVGVAAAVLPTFAAVESVTLQSRRANTGVIYLAEVIGDATTAAAQIELYPGQSVTLDITNSNLVFAISTVAGQTLGITVV